MKYKCGDCGKEKGKNHSISCDIERCPKCNTQLLSCECEFPEITTDEKYLIDENGKKWKRYVVMSLEEDFGE